MKSLDNHWTKAFSLILSFKYIQADVYYRNTQTGVQVMFHDNESVSLVYDDVLCHLLKAYIEITGPVSLVKDLCPNETAVKMLENTFSKRELKSLLKEY